MTTTTSPIYPCYNHLRNLLQDALATSTDNVYETAKALLKIIENYKATDADAAALFSMNKDTKYNSDYRFYHVRENYIPPTTQRSGEEYEYLSRNQ